MPNTRDPSLLPREKTFPMWPEVSGNRASAVCRNSPVTAVGAAEDEQREEAIRQAGQELEAAQARYAASGCFGDAAARDLAKERMYALIRARSPAQVAKMEREAGLA